MIRSRCVITSLYKDKLIILRNNDYGGDTSINLLVKIDGMKRFTI